ncbi:hypothetical protein M433DRAFT_549842 [Acidomyces richmondensis BFW]|nr:MAG: hypothetical protein FE78DRAFT_539884 [Acidomyces sp. 'richmondensis']KYG41046.1 hypothetical protein M433DRAFT_549842 [Acidomyces richmondensis BFW]
MDDYKIERQNTYNTEKKGFMIGQLREIRGILTKALNKNKEWIISDQDDSREWITVLPTICADGNYSSPALIYESEWNQLHES